MVFLGFAMDPWDVHVLHWFSLSSVDFVGVSYAGKFGGLMGGCQWGKGGVWRTDRWWLQEEAETFGAPICGRH